MNTRIFSICISILILFVLLLDIDLGFAQTPNDSQEPSAPQGLAGTAFTYQGKLNKSGTPVDVACDFQFTLYSAASDGSTIGTMQDKPGISLTDGYFSVTLDFGSDAFNGDGRWLGILVKCPPDEAYTDLGRQQITPAPLALALPGLWTQQNFTSTNVIGGYSENWITSGVYGATISGGGTVTDTNRVTDHFGTIGGGANNQVGNADTDLNFGSYATISGGGDNVASLTYATIGGGYSNLASGQYDTIGGGESNQASGWAATIAGGSYNEANGLYATVPGGLHNSAAGRYSFAAGQRAKANHEGAFVWGDSTYADISSTAKDQFLVRAKGGVTITIGSGALRLQPNDNGPNLIGGSSGNWITSGVYGATISGGGWSGYPNYVTDHHGTVGGGVNNRAGSDDVTIDNATYATVSGGRDNQATAENAAVGGGRLNEANGLDSIVPGGYLNIAQGNYSFAAGNRAKANHQGDFVWADSNNFDFSSTVNNEFSVRATGGVRFVLQIDSNGNPTYTCGSTGGAWGCSSDWSLKENLVLAEPLQTLQQLAKVPVYYWNAKGGGARHIGPMAQDFTEIFAVGEDNTSLATIDVDGVALAAIQGLYAENQELKTENADQQAQIEDLEARLVKLEELIKTGNGTQRNLSLNIPWLLSFGLVAIGSSWMARHRSRGG